MTSALPALYASRSGDGAFSIETPDSLLAVLRHDEASGEFLFRLPTSPDRRLRDELVGEFGLGVCAPLPSGERMFLWSGEELRVGVQELHLVRGGQEFLRLMGAPVLALLVALEPANADFLTGFGGASSRMVYLPIVD